MAWRAPASSRWSTSAPGGMVRARDPACRATTPPSRAPASSWSRHCQSAVPSTRKSYSTTPSRPTATMASEVGSAARTARERSTPLPSRWARSRWPSRSSAIRASSRVGTSSRASPTATFAGLPPGAARNTPGPPAGTKSTSASPATATTRSPIAAPLCRLPAILTESPPAGEAGSPGPGPWWAATRGRWAMAVDTFMAYVGVYPSVAAAEEDYDLVKDLHTEAGLIDAYDAAVIERRDDGKVRITRKHETPTRVGGVLGGGVGLATGLVVALFPFAALGGGLLAATTAGGAVLGAVAGHATAGMSRHDLKELGEHLDAGQAGLVVVGMSDMGAKIEREMRRAEKVQKKQLKADVEEIERDARSAGASTNS